MNIRKILITIGITMLIAPSAYAIPTLQVGTPAGPGDAGFLADYVDTATEDDTAFASVNLLYVGGTYGPNDVSIGGQYGSGLDWSAFDFDTSFNGSGAILMATAFGTGSLTVDGASAFYSTNTYKDGFEVSTPPSNHAPVQDGDSYFFFDIGNFSNLYNMMDFQTEQYGNQTGEVKKLSFENSGFDLIHFDVMALVTDSRGVTTFTGNPGSHDVTVPEPASIALMGLGLIGMGVAARRRKKS